MSLFSKFLNALCIVSIAICIALSAMEKDYSEMFGWCVAMIWLSRSLYYEYLFEDHNKIIK